MVDLLDSSTLFSFLISKIYIKRVQGIPQTIYNTSSTLFKSITQQLQKLLSMLSKADFLQRTFKAAKPNLWILRNFLASLTQQRKAYYKRELQNGPTALSNSERLGQLQLNQTKANASYAALVSHRVDSFLVRFTFALAKES